MTTFTLTEVKSQRGTALGKLTSDLAYALLIPVRDALGTSLLLLVLQSSPYRGGYQCADLYIAEKYTLSIDLTSTWTNQTVNMTTIQKTAPVFNSEGLWVDALNRSFYAYGGVVSNTVSDTSAPPNSPLWQFTPSGGSGNWSIVPITQQSSNFSLLDRTWDGAYASGNGLGFSLGGIEVVPTTGPPVPNMIVYNSSTQVWRNTTLFDDGVDTYVQGAALFIPSFGPQGLLAVIAGGQPNANGDGSDVRTTTTVSLFEPLSGLWKTVAVTGSPPHACYQPCLAGAKGDNGTYEVQENNTFYS